MKWSDDNSDGRVTDTSDGKCDVRDDFQIVLIGLLTWGNSHEEGPMERIESGAGIG